MTKSTAIATHLVKLKFASNVQTAERDIFDTFEKHFPVFNYHEWNTQIDLLSVSQLIQSRDSSSAVNINFLITDLWDA